MYGREGELYKLNQVINDVTKSKSARREADLAYRKIIAQMKDKKLMSMRQRLINAAQAGDPVAVAKISAEMKHYLGEDPETGHYGV